MDDLSTLPDKSADFFLSKIEKIREHLAGVSVHETKVQDVGSLDCIQELRESKVYKIIMSMSQEL